MFLCVSAVIDEDALFCRSKFLLLAVVYDIFIKYLQYIYNIFTNDSGVLLNCREGEWLC